MKYCKFLSPSGSPRYAHVEERDGVLWASALMEPPVEDLAAQLAILDSPEPFTAAPLSALQLLPPVSPSKILCIGRNSNEHAAELGNEVPAEPLLFLKPPSSLLAPGGTIRMPALSKRVDYEGELAVVIARRKPPKSAPTKTSRFLHPRLHHLQRRHRPRHPEIRRPMDPGQRLGHLLPCRPHRL